MNEPTIYARSGRQRIAPRRDAVMDEPQTERRKTDDLVLIMATKIETMSDGMVEMRGTMKELVNAITKLAVVEERQAQGSL